MTAPDPCGCWNFTYLGHCIHTTDRRLTAEQIASTVARADQAEEAWLREHPQDYAGAGKAAVDAQVSAILALHGARRAER
jgi:hypothetical protein